MVLERGDRMRLGAFSLVFLLTASPASAVDLADYGFETSVSELLHLERLNRSVRFDAESAIRAEWKGEYDRVTAVELEAVENRYVLFENDALRRVDVAIRGTTNFKNAAFDVEFLKRRSDTLGIYLHRGFEKVAFALYADLRPRLREGYAIRVAGHSLGAAEAIIVGMLLERDGYRVERVLASAPPKVTDAEGWSRFASLPVVRMVGPYDPVPFLPPKSLMYGSDPYVQGGKLLLLLDGTRFTVISGDFFDDIPDVLRQAVAERRYFGVKDHLLAVYLLRLSPKAEGMEYVLPERWESFATPSGSIGEEFLSRLRGGAKAR
jgi:triacylglycerol lipase